MLPTGSDVQEARKALGLTQTQMGERMGYTLRAWQRKESESATRSQLSKGEFELLQILRHAEPEQLLDLYAAVQALFPRIKFLRENPNNDDDFNDTFDNLVIALANIEQYRARMKKK
ncbi:TPA: hypothetical protein JG832_002434 [Enterobacter hormaechei subsp. xiangfangensis]|nr:hypothetical protein [Enterobacter hormaechei subsp. xiangfangensis]HAV1890570.1 hypothetical protein [Enterobacter hormaechei subsp. xiangfangensis]